MLPARALTAPLALQGTFLRMGPKEGRTKADDLGVEQEPVAARPEAGVAEYSPDGVYLALATKDTVEIVQSQRCVAVRASARPCLAALTPRTTSGDTVLELSRHRVVAVAWSPCSRFFVTWERPSETGAPRRPPLRQAEGGSWGRRSSPRPPLIPGPILRRGGRCLTAENLNVWSVATGDKVAGFFQRAFQREVRQSPPALARSARQPDPGHPRRTGRPSSSRRTAACLGTR